MDPSGLADANVVPGSFLTELSAIAAPETFIWSRLVDAVLSVADAEAMSTHARIERWALDEAPLAGRLVFEMFQWLYRENRLCRGTLQLGGKRIGPSSIVVPTLALVNTLDEIAPLGSVKPFIDNLANTDARLLEYPGERGVGLQHLAILVGRHAQAEVWPEILQWLEAHR
jgi:polyhydroxyalkanoate synthase